jgi:hypothetical protein
MHRKHRSGRAAFAAAVTMLVVSGCDFLDPTNVTNPNTTTDDLAEAAEPTTALMPGLRAQMARAVRAAVQTSALLSDDSEVAFTNIGPELLDPYLFTPDGASFNTTGGIGVYWNAQELRAFSDFVLDSIAPSDEGATDAQIAEAHYYRGMAYLLQGENFIAVPRGPDAEPTPFAELLQLAIAEFEAAQPLAGDAELPSEAPLTLALEAALARAHRAAGDEVGAEAHAAAALAMDGAFIVNQEYAAGEIENPFSTETRQYQPLPRLDFLDPKYTTRDAPIAVSKAEEMYLIQAEVDMAAGAYPAAAVHVADAIRLALTRPLATYTDNDERANGDLTQRPNTADILVAAEAGAPLRAGLVLARPGPVTVPAVSGSSLDPDSVAALTDPLEVRHAFWLTRQEILFLEGRRMADLGIRLPVIQRETDTSPAIDDGDPETEIIIPAYIPQGMDNFTPRDPYEAATLEVVIVTDMNRVLAEEGVSAFGPLP